MPTQHRAYLLRLRRDEGQIYWRATLEDAHTGEQQRFATQIELLRYLLQELAQQPFDSPSPLQPDGELHKM